MAAGRGVGTHLFVLLLYCWREAELQLINATTGPTTEESLSSKNQDIPGVFDEILVQEILEPNKSKTSEIQRTTSALSTKLTKQKEDKEVGVDENYQADGSENYHELLDSPQFSSGNEDKVYKTEGNSDENLQVDSPENYQESHVSSEEKKHSISDRYDKLSILDKILQNIGRSPGNSFQ